MRADEKQSPVAAPQAPAITFESVSVWAPSGATMLRGIDWHVRTGERWVLIGPNGSGKTTTLSLAGAHRHPSSGAVTVLGGTLGRVDMPALRKAIGYVDSGGNFLDWLTAEDVVLTGIGSTLRPIWWEYSDDDRVRARELLALFGCASHADREIANCSQGERGRFRIARALISSPRLLLLDEPAVGLDFAAREALIAALDSLSMDRPELTTVLVTHHLEEIPTTTTHAMLLRKGSVVVSGCIDEVLTSENLTACYDLPVECHRHGNRWSATVPAAWSREVALR
jgi:iron complex transport system ATP-binding protein